ncbi:MAG TPA: late competence development ComFB family protein [Spirochaetia bacterium]|nr:late competence development ComFB family protein [Spirochaetales bacterium]HRS66013.1 late competence development ComFB family protein [Spirochaetia bacterium]HOT60548.1 late competence development ComFB family protein [Spirochaetales bacterium]HPD81310.1 late competence development ComFB family protein [Spirochaetales bacterium]HQK34643.1 late competence development ComFB family protein [Spirochaetales bacterium]
MEVHNLMEDLVKSIIQEMFDAEKDKTSWCTCEHCRNDVACYVLNRVKPEYVVSSRGLAYSEIDYIDKLQRMADVVSLIKEGWAKINASPRNHKVQKPSTVLPPIEGPAFNIPPIMGRVFHGVTFEPMSDIDVFLMDEHNEPVTMMDENWQNPIRLYKNTGGTFIFWPRPVKADKVGKLQLFSFSILAKAEGFEELSHFVGLKIASEANPNLQFSMQNVHKLPDLYMLPYNQDEDDTI